MKDKLQELYEILGAACVMAFPCFLFKGLHIGLLFLLLCSLLFYVVTTYRRSIFLYLVLVALAFFGVSRIEGDQVLLLTVAIGAGAGAVGYFVGRWKESPGLFGGITYWYLLLTVWGYFMGIFLKNEAMKNRTCIYAMAILLICMLNENQKAIKAYVAENEKLHRFPTQTLKNRNQTVITVFSMLVLAGMIIGFRGAPADPKLPQVNTGNRKVEMAEVEPMEMMDLGSLELGEQKEPPAWLTALSDFLYHVMEIFVVVLGCVLVVVGIYALYHGYKSHFKKVEETVSEEDEDQIEKVLPKGGALKKLFERKTPSEMIRKYYKKWIRGALKVVPGTEAPAELEKRAGLSDEEFHSLYEKARYSHIACTKEESQRIKQKL